MHICSVEGCDRPVEQKAKGWCDMHYRRWKRHGDPTIKLVKPKRGCTCEIEGCEKPVKGDGLCAAHWSRRKRHNGDPLGGGRDRGWVMEWIKKHSKYDSDECLPWPHYSNPNGYGQVSYKNVRTSANRLMCIIAHGEPPSDGVYEAAHSCGNGHLGCVNPKHLRWATPVENHKDKVKHGTLLKGERHPSSKLTDSQIVQILEALKTEEKQVSIANRFGVGASTITKIKQGHRNPMKEE